MEAIDLTKILEGLDNKWIVISTDYTKILYSADTLDDIPYEIMQKGIVMLVPDSRYARF